MSKLLKADFTRLWKSKLLWILSALMFLAGAFFPLEYYRESVYFHTTYPADNCLMIFAVLAPMAASVFASLFVGTEYHDGTIRNKITAGCSRAAMYLSNLITCLAGGIVLCAAYLIPYFGFSIPFLGKFQHTPQSIALHIGAALAGMASFTALFVLISLLCASKSHAAVFCIMMTFVMFFGCVYMQAKLNEPEYYDSYTYTEGDQLITVPAEKNSNYVAGTKREVFSFFVDYLPAGQSMALTHMSGEKLDRYAEYDFLTFVLSTGAGIFLFRRKDLK